MSTGRARYLLTAAALAAALPSAASAQSLTDIAKFISEGAIAFGIHESAHIAADAAFGTPVSITKVTFGPLPFFAITHEPVSPGREFIISSAGFWTQHATSELILARHPDLRGEHSPVLKGLLAFNVLASVAYSAAAFARAGPAERDTRGMAVSADVGEPVIAALILAPAALDSARYYGRRSRWIVWGSRAAKIGGALLVMKAAD